MARGVPVERNRGGEDASRLRVEREGDTEGESEGEGKDGRSRDEKNQTEIHRDVEEKVGGLSKHSILS